MAKLLPEGADLFVDLLQARQIFFKNRDARRKFRESRLDIDRVAFVAFRAVRVPLRFDARGGLMRLLRQAVAFVDRGTFHFGNFTHRGDFFAAPPTLVP